MLRAACEAGRAVHRSSHAVTPVKPGVYHVEKDIPQGHVAIGHLGKQRDGWDDPDVFALRVMNDILGGGGFTSRITVGGQ